MRQKTNSEIPNNNIYNRFAKQNNNSKKNNRNDLLDL
jgi:hypothetical protein